MFPMTRNGLTGWFHAGRCSALFWAHAAEHSANTSSQRTLLQPFYRFERQLVQAFAAVSDVGDNLIAHAALPEFLEMIENARDGLVVRIARKKERDLVRPMHHAVRFHRD